MFVYTWLKKRCRLKSINHERWDLMDLWVLSRNVYTSKLPNGRRRSAFWSGRKTQKFSGTNQKSERRRPFGTGLVRQCPQGLFSPFFTFLRATFFRPFRLSLAPTICPWVSEDARIPIFPLKTLSSRNGRHFCVEKPTKVSSPYRYVSWTEAYKRNLFIANP